MTTHVIIQARFGSTRLPNKIMMDICGKPMLAYVVERALCARTDGVFIAMTEQDAERMADWPNVVACPVPEHDVAGRFAHVLEKHPCDYFVRLCADSPLIDPQTINRSLNYLADYTIVEEVTGAAECVRSGAFLDMLPRMGPYNREHVTTLWRRKWKTKQARGMPKLTVDRIEDLERVRGIVSRMTGPHETYGDAGCLLFA